MVAEAPPLVAEEGRVRDLGPLAAVLSLTIALATVPWVRDHEVLGLVAAGLAVPLWLTWQYLFGVNAKRLVTYKGLDPVWAVLGWLVPLAMVFMPQMQLVAAARAAHPDQLASKASALVYLWWAGPWAVGIGVALDLPGALGIGTVVFNALSIAMVQVCTRRQQRLAATLR